MQASPTTTWSGIAEGALLSGKYRVERSIGEGGIGMVILARHVELDERVAIKFLRPEALENPEAVTRFAREARASVKIKSEHVARTLDVGKLENGAPYIVMEYLQGADLSDRLRELGPLPIKQAVDFVLEACHALADAHAIGIIHRDIKPSNLFVSRKTDGNETIKVLDFGISKLTSNSAVGADMALTRTQTMVGSPLYMSPEQMAAARDVDVTTDIWALGVTLQELVTGRTPFEAATIPELCTKILTQVPPRLRERRSDAPDGLQAVIDRCLEKDPARRYENIAELAHALAPFGTKRGRSAAEAARRVLLGAGVQSASLAMPIRSDLPSMRRPVQLSAATAAHGTSERADSKRRSGLVALVVLGILMVGAAGAAFVVKHPVWDSGAAGSASAASAAPVATSSAMVDPYQFSFAEDVPPNRQTRGSASRATPNRKTPQKRTSAKSTGVTPADAVSP